MPTKSAAQRRAEARVAYDAYLATCPSRQLLERMGDKWTTLVVNALADGPQRYAELARRIAGVSQKMLTQTLRALERDGMVTRMVTAAVPVRVDYALTPVGRDLLPVLAAVKAWSERHIEAVLDAREAYDAAQASRAG
ncbi:winged helix-turn-helix transcriptional regulator [Actinacidiphila epipremni]|uniref:Helix-turn-helix transcriptional regulator n=1 Tax=Actinacidiphila epipremni TaxID=2053013 RepID=A0ABX0ZYQ6_9ACTN|nr:helix-turn-helix domain-containing protein [Actinacidiphila epipremni]NJP48336.1 helix-turn-helix transcriptional regulator [Actinacidiphila epipremni]